MRLLRARFATALSPGPPPRSQRHATGTFAGRPYTRHWRYVGTTDIRRLTPMDMKGGMMTNPSSLNERNEGALEFRESVRSVMRGVAVDDVRALDLVREVAEWGGATEYGLVLVAAAMRRSLDPDHVSADCPAGADEPDCWVCRADLAVEHVRGLHSGDIYECQACACGDASR